MEVLKNRTCLCKVITFSVAYICLDGNKHVTHVRQDEIEEMWNLFTIGLNVKGIALI